MDEEVYEGLHRTVGPGKISKFVQELVGPHVVRPDLDATYAEMAKDKDREREALAWAGSTFKDIADETPPAPTDETRCASAHSVDSPA